MKVYLALAVVILVVVVGFLYVKGRTIAHMPEGAPQEEIKVDTSPSVSPKATYQNADADMVVVTNPQPGQAVGSTFAVSGSARGGWYFEASFPLEVLDASGTRLVIMPVQAQGEWMTSEFVPFSASVTLPSDYHGPATLILRNDNASGLPEHDRSISIPIIVK